MTNKISRLALFAFLAQVIGITGILHAFDVRELPFESAGTATTVSISTSSWTKVPAATAVLKTRTGVYLNNPASNTSSVVGVFVPVGGTTPATSVRPIEIAKGVNIYLQLGPNMNLYLLSLNATAESVHIQELAK